MIMEEKSEKHKKINNIYDDGSNAVWKFYYSIR